MTSFESSGHSAYWHMSCGTLCCSLARQQSSSLGLRRHPVWCCSTLMVLRNALQFEHVIPIRQVCSCVPWWLCTQNTSSHAQFSQSCQSSWRDAFHTCTRVAQGQTGLNVSFLRALSKKHFHLHTMSLLGVPSVSSSFCVTPPPTWTSSPATLTGIRSPQSATPLLGGQSGHVADPIPTTGCWAQLLHRRQQ